MWHCLQFILIMRKAVVFNVCKNHLENLGKILQIPGSHQRVICILYRANYLKLKLQYFGHLMRRVDSGKDPDAGRDWGQEEKGMTEDEMAGWHHQLNGHEFEKTLGVGDGQGGLACCDSWGRKESDMTEQLN